MHSQHPENVAADNKTAVAAAKRMTKGHLGKKERPWQLRANSDILMEMDKVMQKRGRETMSFQWIPSHLSEEDMNAGLIDHWRWRGNSKADGAATAGRKMQEEHAQRLAVVQELSRWLEAYVVLVVHEQLRDACANSPNDLPECPV